MARTFDELLADLASRQREQLVAAEAEREAKEAQAAQAQAGQPVRLPEHVVQGKAPPIDTGAPGRLAQDAENRAQTAIAGQAMDRQAGLVDRAHEAKGHAQDAWNNAQVARAQRGYPAQQLQGRAPGALAQEVAQATRGAPAGNPLAIMEHAEVGHGSRGDGLVTLGGNTGITPEALAKLQAAGQVKGNLSDDLVAVQGRDGQTILIPREVLSRLGLGGIK